VPAGDAKLSHRAQSPAGETHVGFLLIPDFGLLSYASAVEPLRVANLLSGRQLYRWSHISIDGQPAMASNGVSVEPQFRVGDTLDFDCVFVCAAGNPALFTDASTLRWLQQLARRGVRIGGISGGPFVLARANLLAGYRATIHWAHAPALLEEFPELDLRHSLFEIDRGRLTCSGGASPLDMMHELIAKAHGAELALKVSDWVPLKHVNEGSRPQRMALRERLGMSHDPLLRAIDLMERNLEQPLSRADLAAAAHVSLRQLDRLFRQGLGCSLGEHYEMLRLDRARDLLRQTSLSVLEISVATGFTTASHFSRKFKGRYGYGPRAERAAEVAARRRNQIVPSPDEEDPPRR
jgi:transcriptional regulator GlxA family with amidase domain